MKRILVTGNAGSGKSTLANQIADRLCLPCYSLDGIVWQANWKKTPQAEKDQQIQNLVLKDSWVIDGVSSHVQSVADVVVFLDVPRRVSFWRVGKRNWRFLFRSRPGLPPECPEVLIIPTLIKIIWHFPKTIRTRILDQASQGSDSQRFFHVRGRHDLEKFFATLNAKSIAHQTDKA